jgi:hypothetical protein
LRYRIPNSGYFFLGLPPPDLLFFLLDFVGFPELPDDPLATDPAELLAV